MLEYINELLDALMEEVVSVLPKSPFYDFFQSVTYIPYLEYINWILPISTFVKIGMSWLTAIALYYLVMIILRWIKVIE